MSNSITNRQQVLVLYVALTSFSLTIIPKILAENTGSGGWLTFIVEAIIFGIFAIIISSLNSKYKGLTLYEYSQKIVGKFLTYIIAAIFIIYFLLITMFLCQTLVSIITGNFLFETPPLIIYFSTLVVCGYGAYKGIRNMARLLEIFTVLSIFAVLILHSLMLMQGNVEYIQPLFIPSKINLYMSGLWKFVLPFLGIEVLTIIPMSDQNKKSGLRTFLTVLGIGLIYILVAESSAMMIGMNEMVHYNGPMLSAIRLIEIPNIEFLKRVDIIYIVVGLMGMHAGIILYYTSTVEYAHKIFSGIKRTWVVIATGIVLFICSYFLMKFQDFGEYFNNYIGYVGLFTVGFVPLMLIIVSWFKKLNGIGKKFKLASIIFAVTILVTGCWDSTDIEEKDITLTVIVDKEEEDIVYYVEVARYKQEKEGPGSDSIILKSKGEDLHEAREDLDRKSNKPIYLGATQTLVLTENFTKDGIEEYAYRIRQIPDYRKTLKLTTTSANPEELLKSETENSKFVGVTIEDILQKLIDAGNCVYFTMAHFLEVLASPYKCNIMPSIGLIDNYATLVGYSVFYDSKSVDFIPVGDSEGMILLLADKPMGTFVVEYEENKATIETKIKKRSIKVELVEGKPHFNISFQCESVLRYLEKHTFLTKELAAGLNTALQDRMKEEIIKSIDMSQNDIGHDYLNFYNVFRIKYPLYVKKIDWDEVYKDAQFEVNIKSRLDEGGKFDYGAIHID